MLGATFERLEDTVVRHLANNGASSVSDIHLSLKASGSSKGIPAIYKTLRNLIKNQVVVHRHGSYQLSHTWLFEVAEFIQEALNTPLSDQSSIYLPTSGGQFSWRYSDLRTLNVFASHLITSIAHTVPGGTLYAWSPHPWFNLAQDNHEKIYHHTLKQYQIKTLRIIGGDTPLDNLIIKKLRSPTHVTVSLGDKTFLPRQHYVVLIGGYIITMKLTRATAETIDSLFMRTKSIEQMDIRLFQAIFKNMKNSSQLHIENDADKSAKLIERFSYHFS